jgi:protoporphyrinogen oxidase
MAEVRTGVLVIGGGVTGLAFAQALHVDDYLLCEASDDVGGYCRTVRRNGYVWDYSGHFFHFRNPEIEAELVSRIGPSRVRRVRRCAKVMFKDRLLEFPFQRHIDQLATEDFIECLRGLGSRDAIEPRDFREMLYSRFGEGICAMFMVPYNEKVFATDLAGLDIEAMGRFFPLVDANELLAGLGGASPPTYNSTFTYPEGGAVEFVRALQHGIPPERIRLNEPVVKLDLRRHLAVTPRCTIEYDSLVSTVPLPTLLGLAGLPHDRNLYRHNKVLVFNLGFDSKGPRDVHWIYVPSREVCFYRVGFYDNIWPADRMSLYVEVGCRADADLSCEAIAAMRERVLADLVNTGIVNGQHLVDSHHVLLDPAYVHVTQTSAADVIEQKEVLAARGAYTIGRYGSWTYCSIEDNIVEARRLVKLFNRSS